MYKNLGGYIEMAGIAAIGIGVIFAAHQLRILIPSLLGLAAIYAGQHLRK